MDFVNQIAGDGKVTVLHEGAVLAEGPMAKVQADPRVIEVYLGASVPSRGYTRTKSPSRDATEKDMLDANGIDQYYGGSHSCAACRCRCARRVPGAAGTQWRGQDHAARA